MKKLFLCAVMLVGTVCMSHAQDKIAFGVRAGLNFSTFSYPDGLDYRTGYHVGAVMDWNVAKNLYVQPGLYFGTRGAKAYYGVEETIYTNYLQLPVSVAYRFPVCKKMKIDVNAGPYVALGVGGEYKGANGDSDVFGSEGFCKRFDAGLRFGAGVHFQQFSLGLIYDLGLTNIAKSDDAAPSNPTVRNGAFLVSLGYNF